MQLALADVAVLQLGGKNRSGMAGVKEEMKHTQFNPEVERAGVKKMQMKGAKGKKKGVRLDGDGASADAVMTVKWIEVKDPNSGKIYYYNPVTCEIML